MAERLDKIIAASGIASRKDCKSMIKAGRIAVNGIVAISPDQKAEDADVITVDGMPIEHEKFHYFMMNKPQGYVSSTDDPKSMTVLDLIPPEYRHLHLFPAGRLDKDAVGLLILTDDGDYCHNVISPKKNVVKRYFVRVDGTLTEKDKARFAEGIVLGDGTELLPARLEILSKNEGYVFIREGKYHQVKRMLASLGCPVTYLKRMNIGSLALDETLPEGKIKKLSPDEAASVFLPLV